MSPPLTPSEWTSLVAVILVLVVMLWMVPSCGDPECRQAHQKHGVAQRAAEIEKEHQTFHSPDRPQSLCSLCQGRRRDD